MPAYLDKFSTERRINEDPVPHNLEDILSEPQLDSIARLEASDWFLWFIRRPPGKPPIAFFFNLEDRSVAILENDGKLNKDFEFSFRWDFFY